MKEYLLLRNNKESGPYSLEDLKQMGLKAYDLVWIENRSFSWKYPSEINELSLFAPSLEIVATEAHAVDAIQRSTDIQGFVSEKELPLQHNRSSVTPQPNTLRHPGHVVAFHPKIESIQIKTIKSAAQPKIVKVEVREKTSQEQPLPEKLSLGNGYLSVSEQSAPMQSAISFKYNLYDRGNKFSNVLESLRMLGEGNKMEMIVLAIGTASLLAVAYLLITAGY